MRQIRRFIYNYVFVQYSVRCKLLAELYIVPVEEKEKQFTWSSPYYRKESNIECKICNEKNLVSV